ncbi:MAG: XdhC/CoxI family protein [Ignavibacteriaceae bacterium]|jgi:xanthine dehydrogenase accessory factor|nr:XdhC/CoxI family protein [Ignavibacteriaceae bacterium]
MIEIFQTLQERIKENKPSVLITITEVKGSTPGRIGFKMLVGEEGRVAGTVGGGGAEYYIMKKAKKLIEENVQNFSETILMTKEKNDEEKIKIKNIDVVPMDALCGGEMKVFYEVFRYEKIMYIFGAGHVGQAVAKLAKQLNFYVVFVDNRTEMLEEINDSLCNKKIYYDFSKLAAAEKTSIPLDENAFALLVTHFHAHDLDVLKYIYKFYPGMKYVGMIGSKKKVKESILKLKATLKENTSLENLYSPVGLDIGGETPNEIAIGILAEIQSIIYKKEAKHFRLNYSEID